jgi:hypothetical protein
MHVAPRDFHVTLKPLHLFQIPAFSEAIDRPAAAYINDPSAKPLFDILTLLRLGLTVALSKEINYKRHLSVFPNPERTARGSGGSGNCR